MIWNDARIKEWASSGGVTPYDASLVNPASLDLRLGNQIRLPQARWSMLWNQPIGRKTPASELWTDATEFDTVILLPGQFVLCHSLEYTTLPANASAQLISKSSTGRIGLEHLHCLHGDTLIDAPRDVSIYPYGIPIRSLVGKPFLTYAFDTNAMRFVLAPAMAFPSKRNAEVVKVDYEWMTGRRWKYDSIVCTPDHRFLALDGRWVEAQHLTGERLSPLWRWTDGRYAGIRVDPLRKSNIREHRFIAQQLFDFDSSLQIHHIDGNKLNNNPENLQPIRKGIHQSLHSSGENNPFFGKTHTDETRLKFSRQRTGRKLHGQWRESISRAKSGENNPRYVDVSLAQIITAYQATGKIKDAAEMIGIHESTLLEKIRQNGFSGAVEFRKRIAGMDNHKVTKVTKLSQRIDTYDISVPDYENFVANGVVVHNSGWGDPTFHGQWTWEFHNSAPWPIELVAGEPYMQLVLMSMIDVPERTYLETGRYNGQTGATPHRIIGGNGDNR